MFFQTTLFAFRSAYENHFSNGPILHIIQLKLYIADVLRSLPPKCSCLLFPLLIYRVCVIFSIILIILFFAAHSQPHWEHLYISSTDTIVLFDNPRLVILSVRTNTKTTL